MKHVTRSIAPVMCRTEDHVRWHVLPDWESVLLARGGLRLAEWLSAGRAQRVKHRAGRSIYLIRLDGRTVYMKHERCDGPAQVLANLVRGTAARRQWNNAVEASRRGVPTARPIAFGEQHRHGWIRDSYFITEAIDGAEPLDQYVLDRLKSLPAARRRQLRRLILLRLARFVAGVHQAGLRHRDFHAGNLLVAPDAIEDADQPAFYLIDLAGARFSGPLDWTASRAHLVVLHAEWFDRLSVAERWRFLRTYLAHRPELRHPAGDVMFDELDRGARAHSRRIDRRRDHRALRAGRDFVAARWHGRRLHAVHKLPESLIDRLLQQPESLLYEALDEPVKMSHTSLMVRTAFPLGNGPVPVGFKRYRPRNGWKALCDRFRRSRALRSWSSGHALVARRIATARPLAVCDGHPWDRAAGARRSAGWWQPRESYLAVEWIEGAENLHLWAWRLAERPPAERGHLVRLCAERLGELVGRMHARCVSHRDLKGSNLLVAQRGRELQTWLVDMDGVRIHRHLSVRRCAADLARLATSVEAHPWVTQAVRYRFLRAYAKQFPRGFVDERSLWQAAGRRARRQIAQRKRKGKPLL